MGSFGKYFRNIRNSAGSILDGMAVTLSWMFRRPYTIQYPDRIGRPVQDLIAPRFRGLLEVALPLCTGCQLCQRTCPIEVILVEVKKGADGNRYLTRFDIDVSKCMVCGLCAEACPTGAIRHTREFEMSCDDIRKLVLHYVTEPVLPYKPSARIDAAAVPPVGSIVKRLTRDRHAPYVPYVPVEPPSAEAPPAREGKP